MELLRKATLFGYHACSKSHHAAGTFIYPIIPKHHHFDHLLRWAIAPEAPKLTSRFAPLMTLDPTDDDSIPDGDMLDR